MSEVVALSVIDTRVDRRERLAVFSGALDLVDARGLAVGPHLRDPEVGLHLLQILTEMQGRWEHRTDDSQRVPACDDHHFVGRPDPVPGPLLRRPQGGMAGRKLQLLQVEVEDIAVRHDVRRACGRPRPRCQITRLLRPGTAPVLEAVERRGLAAYEEIDLIPGDVACAIPSSTGTPLDHDVERDEMHLLPLDVRRRRRAVLPGVAIGEGRAGLRDEPGRTVSRRRRPNAEGEHEDQSHEAFHARTPPSRGCVSPRRRIATSGRRRSARSPSRPRSDRCSRPPRRRTIPRRASRS